MQLMPRVRSEDSLGLSLALAGFVMLSIGDAVIKTIAGSWPGTAVALTRYTIGAVLLVTLLARVEGRGGFRVPRWRWQLLRGLGVGMATLGFFSAVFVMPLAEATAISFTSPMLTAVLAPLLLREKLQRSSIAALIVAFGGVLVILRPSLADLGMAALLPLMAALGMSLLMIGNRAVAGSGSSLAMQATVATLAVPVLAAATVAGHLSGLPELHVSVPDRSVVARCALVAVTASFAHWLVFLGTERASAARVAPMTYVQLLTAQSLGWALFSEPPDGLTVVGAAIIVSAGLWLWWSGRVKEPVPTE